MAVEPAEALVGRNAGIVTELVIHAVSPADPRLSYVSARLAGSGAVVGAVAPNRESAVVRCLFEAIERYAALRIDGTRITRDSATELRGRGERTLDPPALFAADGRPFGEAWPELAFDPARRLDWIRGEAIPGGEEVWVPASLAYVDPSGDRLFEPTTTGLAADPSPVVATARALCEVVERDALMRVWLTRRPAPRLDTAAHPLVELFDEAGIDVAVHDLATDLGLPAVLAVARRRHGKPAAAIGSACAGTLDAAVTKAVLEAAHTHYLARALAAEDPLYRPRPDFSDVTSFRRRALLYAQPELTSALGFLDAETPPADRREVADPAEIVEHAASLPGQVVRVDLTPPELAELGACAVRVLATALQPMEETFALRRYAPPRLGLDPTPDGGWARSLNPYPHPAA